MSARLRPCDGTPLPDGPSSTSPTRRHSTQSSTRPPRESRRDELLDRRERPALREHDEQDQFWDLYLDGAREVVVRGKLVPDAHLTALLRQRGLRTLHAIDCDFRKFDFLDVRNPFETTAG